MLGVGADIIYARIIYFYLVVALIYLEKKNVILGGRMDFADILQSMKNEKGVKTLIFRVVLDSLRTVCQVFDTFFSFFMLCRMSAKSVLSPKIMYFYLDRPT